MRRWMSGRLFGALLALTVVVSTTATAFADPRDFSLINDTGHEIDEVYVTQSNLDDWGDNLIPDGKVLPSGNQVPIVFQKFTDGNCYYDIKVVTTGGAEGELNQVNLCETNTVTFN